MAKVIAIGVQVPVRVVHGRCAPSDADNHEDDEVVLRFNDPSPALNASTVCGFGLVPGFVNTGPTATVLNARRGAANRAGASVKMAINPYIRVGREESGLMICSILRGSDVRGSDGDQCVKPSFFNVASGSAPSNCRSIAF